MCYQTLEYQVCFSHFKELSNELGYEALSQGALETQEVKLLAFKIYLINEILLVPLTSGNSDGL